MSGPRPDALRFVEAFRDGGLARGLAEAIRREADPGRVYRFMEFCGGHTHAIARYGVEDLLPENIRMIHGPGCPVCVLPVGRVALAIELAGREGVTLCTYGDMLRVPGPDGDSLLKARARGADVRMVYSAADALAIARRETAREVVFFAIGFETTTPPTALVIRQAAAEGLANFSVLCNHVLTPSAMRAILEAPEVREFGRVPIDGFVGPAHVSTVIGTEPYRYFAEEYRKPVVVAGFEPLDVMQAVRMLVRQVNEGRAEVENEYARAVRPEGNRKAQELVAEVFELRRSFEWRGLGLVPYSALRIKAAYAAFDAERRFALEAPSVPDHRACACAAILRGARHPRDCRLFGTVCTPQTPVGSCMVSSEGACAAYYTYGRFRPSPSLPTPPEGEWRGEGGEGAAARRSGSLERAPPRPSPRPRRGSGVGRGAKVPLRGVRVLWSAPPRPSPRPRRGRGVGRGAKVPLRGVRVLWSAPPRPSPRPRRGSGVGRGAKVPLRGVRVLWSAPPRPSPRPRRGRGVGRGAKVPLRGVRVLWSAPPRPSPRPCRGRGRGRGRGSGASPPPPRSGGGREGAPWGDEA
ncbi:hydrogenase formation protein HypD [Inmirania thermothiophila]|uniref:Hydrogenase expression/formation protein HypD n=1 Tax=Inmirania thermothiophila TaxID=1750597 RepID=A0A3N1Y129_9GAMM|nr:hydrogenase expression/formation protein HypD [Inmirania thermothiophila]